MHLSLKCQGYRNNYVCAVSGPYCWVFAELHPIPILILGDWSYNNTMPIHCNNNCVGKHQNKMCKRIKSNCTPGNKYIS